VRISSPLLAIALVAGCGEGPTDDSAEGSGEVSVMLPPPLPATAEQEAAVARKAKAAPPEETSPTRLVSAKPPIAMNSLARYIRGAGFECDEVVTSSRVEGAGFYKFDCTTGGSYRGTMRNNHLYFRPWTGSPRGN
jgi:hypothetical protein